MINIFVLILKWGHAPSVILNFPVPQPSFLALAGRTAAVVILSPRRSHCTLKFSGCIDGHSPILHTVRKWGLWPSIIQITVSLERVWGWWILSKRDAYYTQARQRRAFRVDGIYSLSCPTKIPTEFRVTFFIANRKNRRRKIFKKAKKSIPHLVFSYTVPVPFVYLRYTKSLRSDPKVISLKKTAESNRHSLFSIFQNGSDTGFPYALAWQEPFQEFSCRMGL